MRTQELFFPLYFSYFLLLAILYSCTALVFVLTLFHKRGILHRFLQRWIEAELSKVTNGSMVTIGSLNYQIIHLSSLSSKLILNDVILHNPNREDWKWDSPLLARTGRVEVKCHLLSLIQFPTPEKGSWAFKLYKWMNLDQFLPIARDIYTVVISDVQCFAEKRRNVFNFHLLDVRLDIPDAKEVLASIKMANNQQLSQDKQTIECSENNKGICSTDSSERPNDSKTPNGVKNHQRIDTDAGNVRDASLLGSQGSTEIIADNNSFDLPANHKEGPREALPEKSNNATILAETKANEIVMQMLGAVTDLGRAANEGGTRGLSDVLKNQKDGFVSHLKKVQSYVGTEKVNGTITSNEQRSRSSKIAKEGLQVINEVGRVVKKNVLDMKEQVDALSKPPPVKEGWVPPGNDNLRFRFGSIFIKDLRVFTKDMILAHRNVADSNNTGVNSVTPTTSTISVQSSANPGSLKSTTNDNLLNNCQTAVNCTSGWSKPIHIKEVLLDSVDLTPQGSPPMNQMSTSSTIGCPIEDIGQIILTRILTETAKSSTGQVFNNAFSEVIDWLEVKGMNGA